VTDHAEKRGQLIRQGFLLSGRISNYEWPSPARTETGRGKSYLAESRSAWILSKRSTTMRRSRAFSALRRSGSLWLLRLETCLSEPLFGCRARSRATCRLSTFFILLDRDISAWV